MLTLEGNLGKDPEVKYGANGQEFCHFPVAVNNNKTNQACWYNVTCNGALVSVATKYLKKGDPVLIIGKLTAREYTNNGVKGISLDVFANLIDLIASKPKDPSNTEDPTDFNPEQYEEELEKASVGASTLSSNPNVSSSSNSTNKKATAALPAKPK